MKNEAGGHRIQRVPPTEKRGRVHTSTVTVAVVSQPDSAVYAQTTKNGCLDPRELSYRWHSGTGKGGQHRNKHQNCLELTHNPTGIKQSANGRCRITNEAEALAAIQEKIAAQHTFREHSTINSARSEQIGSGMRGDKRRTYRFQDDNVTDHETGKSASVKRVMKGGFDELWR